MPIIKSAKKRVKVASKANARNTRTKRSMREALKAFNKAIADGSAGQIAKTEKEAMRAVDRAAKKAVIHKNKAARMKSAIASQVKSKGVKPAKTAPKKAAPKSVARKPAAKKPTTKK